jgi:protein-S-isoprenylcysteine O-methyltransferase Ste14
MADPGVGTDVRRRAWRAALFFGVAVWLQIFLAAGTLAYWQGWLFWTNFLLWIAGGSWYLLKHDPALAERRLRAGPAAEREPFQKLIQVVLNIAIGATFVVSGLDRRFGWSAVPWSLVIAANVLAAAGNLFVLAVFRANSFASATIEVGAGQTVVSTGPYALVRHPMYAGALIMFLAVPLALGSWWGLVPVVALAAGLAARLKREEDYLVHNLSGYAVYRDTVRWRLLPGVW